MRSKTNLIYQANVLDTSLSLMQALSQNLWLRLSKLTVGNSWMAFQNTARWHKLRWTKNMQRQYVRILHIILSATMKITFWGKINHQQWAWCALSIGNSDASRSIFHILRWKYQQVSSCNRFNMHMRPWFAGDTMLLTLSKRPEANTIGISWSGRLSCLLAPYSCFSVWWLHGGEPLALVLQMFCPHYLIGSWKLINEDLCHKETTVAFSDWKHVGKAQSPDIAEAIK